MKYFTVDHPYYALIKAKSGEEAIKMYIELVSDDEDGCLEKEMREVPREEALVMFSRVKDDETGKFIAPDEVVRIFNEDEPDLLGIDSDLA